MWSFLSPHQYIPKIEGRCCNRTAWQIPFWIGSLFDFAFLIVLTTLYWSDLENVYTLAQLMALFTKQHLKVRLKFTDSSVLSLSFALCTKPNQTKPIKLHKKDQVWILNLECFEPRGITYFLTFSASVYGYQIPMPLVRKCVLTRVYSLGCQSTRYQMLRRLLRVTGPRTPSQLLVFCLRAWEKPSQDSVL